MDSKFWDKLSEDYNSEIFDVRKNDKKKIVEKWISKISAKEKKVADIGCAIGKWLPLLSKKFSEVSAIDFSTSLLHHCKLEYGHLENVSFSNIDMTKILKTSNKFDVVVSINSILIPVHSKREIFFQNIRNVLRRDGHLVLVVPSLESVLFSEFIYEKCSYKAGKPLKKPSGKIDINELTQLKQGIVRLDNVPTKHYLKEELISILTDLGFQIEKIDKVEYDWKTELVKPPRWVKDPYPWDWLVVATKKK